MKYIKQVTTVTLWEYRRFFKPKNELIGLVVGLLIFLVVHFGARYIMSDRWEKSDLMVSQTLGSALLDGLSEDFNLSTFGVEDLEKKREEVKRTKTGLILTEEQDTYVLFAYKKSKAGKRVVKILNDYSRETAMKKAGLSPESLAALAFPAKITNRFILPEKPINRVVLAYAFAGLLVLAVFLSFAYQFTAITGEKQQKITEQIISAVKPQVWMDGKILGITLTGLSSMVSYTLLSLLYGSIFFQLTGIPAASVLTYVHVPSMLLFLTFSLLGILQWNAVMAGIAALITDPNSSGKSSLMMLPLLFVFPSFMIISDPDSSAAIFLSWFPLTSASAMPIRWAISDVSWWGLLGSWILLAFSFYLLRRLAAKVFRLSILISGKEPGWTEVLRWIRRT